MTLKIQTRHPQRKNGRSISREKYDQVRAAILEVLERGELTHTELMRRLDARLRNRFDGNPHWYGETVKLDLEARRVIERTDARPPMYRRIDRRPRKG
ncbi:MAG TPA: hypothetical protein VL295_08945 [Gemmatimonadales bacterium]|jgi:Family of unknown function (DUF6958)|nr:hypothetical protein [Gemmatimonadales bacterium]